MSSRLLPPAAGAPSVGRVPVWARRVGWAVVVPALLAVLLTLYPAAVDLSGTPGFLHLVSFRLATGIGCLVIAGIVVATLRLPRTRRPLLRLTSAVLLAAVGLGQGAVVISRGWAADPLPGRADLTVVSFNTLKGHAGVTPISDLIMAEGAQMVSLPETVRVRAQKIVERLHAAGADYTLFTTSTGEGLTQTTSLLVRSDLGVYRQVPGADLLLGSVRVVPVSGRGPTLVAVHAGAPVSDVGYDRWSHDVAAAVGQCSTGSDVVVAGDFNATVDHGALASSLGRCLDAATAAGRGAEGTWPSWAPAAFAAPIDHVLVNSAAYRVLGIRTERIPASDHRALIARFALVPGP